MKTLNTLLTLSLLAISTSGFAYGDGGRSAKNVNVPVAPDVWSGSEIEAPGSLKFLKAKSAFVPVAGFVWGDPAEAPADLSQVPVAPFVYGDAAEITPADLKLVAASTAQVPPAPFIWGEPAELPVK